MFGAAGDGPEVNYDADGPGSAACVKCVACEHVQHTVSSLCSVSLSLLVPLSLTLGFSFFAGDERDG